VLGTSTPLLQAQPLATLAPPTGGSTTPWPPAPWVAGLLPAQTLPTTRFEPVVLDGQPAVRIEAAGSYGNLLHPLARSASPGLLRWRWRLEEPNPAADLRRREGDDTNLKVCLLFDLPIGQVPFVERQLLRLARSRSGEPLPAATLCYVWDPRLAAGTRLDNPYSRRVRYLVLRGAEQPLRRWVSEQRDVAADFRAAFGDESPDALPPLQAVAVGADNDNTGGRSLAYLADLVLEASR